MILSTLVTNLKKMNVYRKTSVVYLILTILLLIFSIVYLQHSYGVNSNYMRYLSLITCFGFILFTIFSFIPRIRFSRVAYNAFNAAMLSFVLGSGLQGIFEICGSHSFYMWIYIAVGVTALILSIIFEIIVNTKKLLLLNEPQKENGTTKKKKRKNRGKGKKKNNK